MLFENVKLTLKDAISYGVYLITLVGFLSSLSSKVDQVIRQQEEDKMASKELKSDYKIFMQNIQNQVNSNSLQINLIQKDIQMMKDGYYGKRR